MRRQLQPAGVWSLEGCWRTGPTTYGCNMDARRVMYSIRGTASNPRGKMYTWLTTYYYQSIRYAKSKKSLSM